MPMTFTENWAQEVADVSGLPEFQNALIEIRDPSLISTTFNVKLGPSATVQTGNSVVWSGQARVADYRSVLSIGSPTAADPTTYKLMIVQIPYIPNFMHVKRGWQIRIVNGGRNASLEQYLFNVDSDIATSNVGSTTIHCSIDVTIVPSWV